MGVREQGGYVRSNLPSGTRGRQERANAMARVLVFP